MNKSEKRQDIRRIIHDICKFTGMGRAKAKFVPWILGNDQQDWRIEVCAELREAVAEDPSFLSKIVTNDETWV